MPKLAVKWYQKALDKLPAESGNMVGLLYALGESFVDAGETEEARGVFGDVYGLDPKYRDIEKLVKDLEGE